MGVRFKPPITPLLGYLFSAKAIWCLDTNGINPVILNGTLWIHRPTSGTVVYLQQADSNAEVCLLLAHLHSLEQLLQSSVIDAPVLSRTFHGMGLA